MSKPSTASAEVTLPTDTQILITREFDAPPELVYEAWTTPELIERWWGSRRGRVTSAEVDLRVGGTWRYVMVAEGGFEVAFHGEFHEIVPNERLVNTEVFEAMPDAESMITATFAGIDGARTRLEQLCAYPNREIRDAVIDSGMEGGMQDSMDALEEVAIGLGE